MTFKYSHRLIRINQSQQSTKLISNQEKPSMSNKLSRHIDVSLTISSYNIVLVVDVSLSMIGYKGT
ncbi:unnamed protein product, partial [Rotaria sp. Silwood2]